MSGGKKTKKLKTVLALKSKLTLKQITVVWVMVALVITGLMFWAANLANKAMSAIPIINNGYNGPSCWPYGWPANTQKGTRSTTSSEVLNNSAYQKFYVTGEAASSDDHVIATPAGCDLQNINVVGIEPTGSPCIYFDSQKNYCVVPLGDLLKYHIATRITGTATDSRIYYQFCDGFDTPDYDHDGAPDYKTTYPYHRGGYKITFQCALIAVPCTTENRKKWIDLIGQEASSGNYTTITEQAERNLKGCECPVDRYAFTKNTGYGVSKIISSVAYNIKGTFNFINKAETLFAKMRQKQYSCRHLPFGCSINSSYLATDGQSSPHSVGKALDMSCKTAVSTNKTCTGETQTLLNNIIANNKLFNIITECSRQEKICNYNPLGTTQVIHIDLQDRNNPDGRPCLWQNCKWDATSCNTATGV